MMRLALAAALLLASLGAPAQVLHNGGISAGTNPVNALAAATTAQTNAVCVGGTIGSTTYAGIQPFWIAIGDSTGILWQDSVANIGTSGQVPVTGDTSESIASASKMLYGITVAQIRQSAPTSADISFLTFSSGYTGMGDYTQGQTCPAPSTTTATNFACNVPPQPASSGSNTVNYCLTLCVTAAAATTAQPVGTNYNRLVSGNVGLFDYDAGHEQNHAGQQFSSAGPQYSGQYLANQPTATLGAQVVSILGLTGQTLLTYNQPLFAGGVYTTGNRYGTILRRVIDGTLYYNNWIGLDSVVAYCGSGTSIGPTHCPAAGVTYSPITLKWRYSLAGWVETDADAHNDQSQSSPGAFGFYPWFTPKCPAAGHAGQLCHTSAEYAASGTWANWGVVSRYQAAGSSGNPTGNGQSSAACAALVRAAWFQGTVQTGAIPSWPF